MHDFCFLSLGQAAAALQKREVSASEAVQMCLKRISETEPKIEALLAKNEEEARACAESMDGAGPDAAKPLWGVPVTIKDALSTKDIITTAASKILENYSPFYDAFVVSRLKEAGAIILAKANMDEFAMGSATENSAYQKTKNPWNLNCVPGGSSGGSAASVAACQCFASLGSDTGGSIRQPAAFCGCVGLKPTYGRVSRYGLLAFGSSLDQVGPLARSVIDCALVLNVIAGHDPRDNTSEPLPVADYTATLKTADSDKPMAGLRIGIDPDFFGPGLSSEVRKVCSNAIQLSKEAGAEIIDIKLPDPSVATAAYYIIAMAEASSNLARYDGVKYGRRATGVSSLDELYLKSRSQGFGAEVKRRIMLGSFVLSAGYFDAYFRKAAQIRRLIYDGYLNALTQCDVICMPVAPVTAWQIGAHAENPLQEYLLDAFTLPINLAGLPGLSIPAGIGETSKLPVGLQLVGKHFQESELLRCGYIMEQLLPSIGYPNYEI